MGSVALPTQGGSRYTWGAEYSTFLLENVFTATGYLKDPVLVSEYISHLGDLDTYIRFQTNICSIVTGGNTGFYQDASGNVGIGTTAPANKLDVVGMIRSTGFESPATGVGIRMYYLDGVGQINSYDSAASYMPTQLGIGSQLVLATTGNVGIGTASPGEKLEVNGNILFNSQGRYIKFSTAYGTPFTGSMGLIQAVNSSYASEVAAIEFYQTGGNTADTIFRTGTAGSSTERMRITSTGNVGIGLTPTAHMVGLSVEAGVLTLKETTTPTADANYGKVYTKTDNALYFQDGAGNEHIAHKTAFGGLWFHNPSADVVTIATEDKITKITSFENSPGNDELANVTVDVGNNEMVVGANAAGIYHIEYNASITATGASKTFVFCVGVELATPLDITDVTDNTVSPIVVTSTAHGLKNGDMVRIAGVLVNTAANGDFVVTNKADNTFELVAVDGTATTGNGDYDAGTPTGDITHRFPGQFSAHRVVSQADVDYLGGSGLEPLLAGDTVALHAANLDDATDLNVFQVNLCMEIQNN